MGNKEEELEVCLQLLAYSLSRITELWWDSSHHCHTAVHCRKDGLEGHGEGAALCMETVGSPRSLRKGFYRYISSKRKTRKNVGPFLSEARDLMTKDMERTGVFHVFFVSVFTGKTILQESKALETDRKVWNREYLLLIEMDHVSKDLNNLNIHIFMEPSGMHPWILRELLVLW